MRRRSVPQIITFYSYKGGTGRTLALANVAWLLAAAGYRVCAVDWDLEGPGLHRYFRPFLSDPDLKITEGLIDWLWEVSALQLIPQEPDSQLIQQESDNVLQSTIMDYMVHIAGDFSKDGKLDFLPAGRQDMDYAKRINAFEWNNFYERLGGWSILDRARKMLKEAYDFVLIDSRTGVSDTSGICTIQFPDRLVACYTLNRQSIEGVMSVLTSVQEQRGDRSLKIFPVEMRVETGEKLKLDAARSVARPLFDRFIPEDGDRPYWDDMEVVYWPFYAFEECLAAYADDPATQSRISMLATMQRIAMRVSGVSDMELPRISSTRRREILRMYSFADGIDDEPTAVERPAIFDEVSLRYRIWLDAAQDPSDLLQPSILNRLDNAGPLPADLRSQDFKLYVLKSRDAAERVSIRRRYALYGIAGFCIIGALILLGISLPLPSSSTYKLPGIVAAAVLGTCGIVIVEFFLIASIRRRQRKD